MEAKQILVVEDNSDDGLMLRHVVEMVLKHQAALAPDGAQAIRLAEQQQFDLVLLDINLPQVNGWDVAESLRRLAGYDRVPIIAVTAYDLAGYRERMLQAGCDLFLTKPFSLNALTDAITRFLPPESAPAG